MKPRIAKETDAKNKEDLEKQVKEAEEPLANAKPQAMKYFANACGCVTMIPIPAKLMSFSIICAI